MDDALRGDPRYEAAALAAAGAQRWEAVNPAFQQQLGDNNDIDQLAEQEVDDPVANEARQEAAPQAEGNPVQLRAQQQGAHQAQGAPAQPQAQAPPAQQPAQVNQGQNARAGAQAMAPGNVPHRTLRRAAVLAMQDINTSMNDVRTQLQASNDIQRDRNNILRELLLGELSRCGELSFISSY